MSRSGQEGSSLAGSVGDAGSSQSRSQGISATAWQEGRKRNGRVTRGRKTDGQSQAAGSTDEQCSGLLRQTEAKDGKQGDWRGRRALSLFWETWGILVQDILQLLRPYLLLSAGRSTGRPRAACDS